MNRTPNLAGSAVQLRSPPRTLADWRQMIAADDERRLEAEITSAQTERLTATVH
jgi:hypothetical protein